MTALGVDVEITSDHDLAFVESQKLEVGREFSEEDIAVGAEPDRYAMTRLTTVHPTAMTEKERLSVRTQQGMDTAREAPVGYVSGDASVVVGSAVNCQTDAERRRACL